MDPFLKAVGGKRWLAADLAREIIAIDPVLYVEPFVGGGAITLTLPPKLPKYVADVNPAFVAVWQTLKTIEPQRMFDALALLRSRFPETSFGYVKAREALNDLLCRMPADRALVAPELAALTLHINVRSFNGIWRVNQDGAFNVPYNKAKSPRVITLAELRQYHDVLQTVTAEQVDFRIALNSALGRVPSALRRRLAVYADPPYDQTFDGYSSDGFDKDDQRNLAEWLRYLVDRGVRVWATNSDTPLIREIYAWARITPLDEMHTVGSTAARRGTRKCLMIRGGL